VTLAESCISNKERMCGAVIKLDDSKNMRRDALLFGEAPSRIVVSLNKDNLPTLEKIAKKYSIPYQILGNVGGKKLTIRYNEKTLIDLPLTDLSQSWRESIPRRLGK